MSIVNEYVLDFDFLKKYNTQHSEESETKENNYLINKTYTFNNINYNIIKYDKQKLKKLENSDYELFKKIALCRSVIFRNNKLLSFSPSKSINYDTFKQSYIPSESWLEDFVDGTMINVFFDDINNVWEVSTKSTVGANIIFFNDTKNYKYFTNNTNNRNLIDNNDYDNSNESYHNTTFRTLFFEACNVNNFNINTLDPTYVYTFVFQHPLNRIVTPTMVPMIYLVKVYQIINSENKATIKEFNIQEFYSAYPYVFLNTNIKCIGKYNFENYESIEKYYNNDLTPYEIVGTMLYNKDGSRSKIRNKNYEYIRQLRGNKVKLQFNYLHLKNQNKVNEFLHYYPEHKFIFNKFKNILYNFTQELFINYVNCYIKKEKPLKEFPFEYKTHMFKIHEKYKNELKINNKNVDKKVVIDYISSLHPAQIMFSVNYKNKKLTQNNEDIQQNNEDIQETSNNNDVMVQ